MGYQPVEADVTFIQRVRLGFVFFWIYGFALLGMVAFAQMFKYTLRRQRPTMPPGTVRIHAALRTHEEGTFAMPSGDTGAAGVFCYVYAATLSGMTGIYLLIPLVALGRVYYYCHWLGDTIAGSVLGLFWGSIIVSHFDMLLPIFSVIAGSPDLFKPLV